MIFITDKIISRIVSSMKAVFLKGYGIVLRYSRNRRRRALYLFTIAFMTFVSSHK